MIQIIVIIYQDAKINTFLIFFKSNWLKHTFILEISM